MSDKFSYYDFIANIVPSVFLLWGLSITPIRDAIHLNMDGAFTEGIVFLVLAYVIGLVIQALAKVTIEPLMKRVFWDGRFFSQVCLLKSAGHIKEPLHSTVIRWAEEHAGVTGEMVKKLEGDSQEAQSISHLIYRKADAYTTDKGQAQKAHMQNNLYSLYRDLCLSALVLAGILGWYLLDDIGFRTTTHWILLGFTLVCALVFFLRTRYSGELYVKGIFWALQKS